MNLFVAPDGTIAVLYGEAIDLQNLGTTAITRASNVEPDDRGQWFAMIIDGPRLGPFGKRSEALAAEVDWLTQHCLCPREILSQA